MQQMDQQLQLKGGHQDAAVEAAVVSVFQHDDICGEGGALKHYDSCRDMAEHAAKLKMEKVLLQRQVKSSSNNNLRGIPVGGTADAPGDNHESIESPNVARRASPSSFSLLSDDSSLSGSAGKTSGSSLSITPPLAHANLDAAQDEEQGTQGEGDQSAEPAPEPTRFHTSASRLSGEPRITLVGASNTECVARDSKDSATLTPSFDALAEAHVNHTAQGLHSNSIHQSIQNQNTKDRESFGSWPARASAALSLVSGSWPARDSAALSGSMGVAATAGTAGLPMVPQNSPAAIEAVDANDVAAAEARLAEVVVLVGAKRKNQGQ